MKTVGFASLQPVESRLVQSAFADCQAEWLLEVAPALGPSPSVDRPRTRLLFDDSSVVWPLRAHLDEWPLDDESVPAVLARHLWQPAVSADPLDEILRVLKPGGLLVSVSANPWHRLAWRELGRDALRLPSWPHLQLRHARHQLKLSVPAASQWRGLVPGLTPVLVLMARKPRRPALVRPMKFRRPVLMPQSAAASLCRAA